MSTDPRSRRIAVVADSLLDATIDELGPLGYGFIQLPPGDLDAGTTAEWIDQTAEHVAEFLRNGYEVVLVDDGLNAAALSRALAGLGPQYAIQPPSTSRLTPET